MTIIVHDRFNRGHKSYAYRDHLEHPYGCFQSEAYVCGDLPAHYPLPVKTDTDTAIYSQWYENGDGYWHWQPWKRVEGM